MRRIVLIVLFLIASCTTPQKSIERQCPLLSAWNGTACCQDLDENRICDNKDAALLAQLDKEPIQRNPPKSAPKPVIMYPLTVVSEALAKSNNTAYEFQYEGAHYIVSGNRMRKDLYSILSIGKQTLEDVPYEAAVNRIIIDRENKTVQGYCYKPREDEVLGKMSPCDRIKGLLFPLSYIAYANITLPQDILARFGKQQPFEVLPNEHAGKRLATLAVFRKNRQNQTLLWIDNNGFLIRYQEIINGKSTDITEFRDLFVVNETMIMW